MRLAPLLLVPATALAEPVLRAPIDCTLGQDCYLQNLFDRDPGPGATDAACGAQSYDGHRGTDFALASVAAMQAGVEVLAAAPGVVSGTRDGEPDAGPEAMTPGRDCGNGVAIDHGGGWLTQYCHLRRGSVAVEEGARVAAGDVLGLVGLSGNTEFPHVHLSVFKDGERVDPLDPDGGPCGETGDQIFDPPLEVTGGGIVSAGLLARAPSYEEARAGIGPEPLGARAPLVGWLLIHGARPGDVARVRIVGPGGEAVIEEDVLDRAQALAFRYMGRRAPGGGWPAGAYEMTAEHLRGGRMLARAEASGRVE